MLNPYIGRDEQLFSVEEHRLVGGRGDGMRLFEVVTGGGLEMAVAADRCLDIYRLRFRGVNLGYFSASGYVAPAYFDARGDGFLDSFTGGFLTTCGLTHMGAAGMDGDEALGLHGPIGAAPADGACAYIENGEIIVRGTMYQARQFSHKLRMDRVIRCPVGESAFTITDRVTNFGDRASPLMVLYHMNFGYPLLDEGARISVNSSKVVPRTAHAAKDLDTWNRATKPAAGFEEQCYFHFFDGAQAIARVENAARGVAAEVSFDLGVLTQLTQWKMMGVRDYVMGLEPGTNDPDGRAAARANGTLRMLAPGETVELAVRVRAEGI
ncbi:MAG: aldose 1-epimerase family protein [Christensenellales bacterium]